MTIDNGRGFGIWSEGGGEQFKKEQERPQYYTITIKEIPDGTAPESIRKGWLGLSMVAKRVTLSTPQIDPLQNNEPVPSRPGFRVARGTGLFVLRIARRTKAFNYFSKNWPDGVDFIFRDNEVEFSKVERDTSD